LATKPLVLKRQKAKASTRSTKFSASAEVTVCDLPFHIDKTFTYGIPDEFLDSVKIGSRVKVPFLQSEKTGYIRSVSLKEVSARPILSIKTDFGISENHWSFLQAIAERYATNLDTVLKFVRDSKLTEIAPRKARFKPRFEFASIETTRLIIREIEESQGVTLIIAPTEKELLRVQEQLNNLGVSANRCRFGLRSAILQEIEELENIVIFDEWSEHYREQKAPYWNVRDLALIRARMQSIRILFVSALPSFEIFRYQEEKIVQLGKRRGRKLGERLSYLPSSFQESVKNGLKQGSVLISVATKDVLLAMICRKCRTALRCKCGGRLRSSGKKIICSLCTEAIENWRCRECNHRDFYEIKSGALNLKNQLGKIFPNTPIYISTADKPAEVIQGKAIIIATPGVEPKITYHAIAILECEYRANLPYLRADEILRLQVFSIMELLSPNGYFYLDLEGNHPLVQSILKDRPLLQMEREYREFRQLQLPPIWNLTRISNGNILQLASSLAERFPATKIQITSGDRFLLVRTKIEDTPKLMEELKILQKYLSMKSERLFKIERDPVNL